MSLSPADHGERRRGHRFGPACLTGSVVRFSRGHDRQVPGSKTLAFAAALEEKVGRGRLHITMVESRFSDHPDLAHRLVRAADRHASAVAVSPLELATFVGRQDSEVPCDYNLISLVHVLYDPRLVAPLVRLLRSLVHSSPVGIFAVCEAPDSDFSKMRKLLASAGHVVPKSQLDRVESLFVQLGFSVNSFRIDNQLCRVDLSEVLQDDAHWLFPFLLGCDISIFAVLPNDSRRDVLSIVRSYLLSNRGRELALPDIGLLATSSSPV